MTSMSLALISTLFLSTFASGNQLFSKGDESNCETLLSQELKRSPDDYRNGLVTDRIPVSASNVLAAYQRGIFPWGVSAQGLGRWYSPTLRGVLFFDELRIGRSDRKFLKRALAGDEYRITFNKNFASVIRACADQPRYTRTALGYIKAERTWISPEIIQAYTDLHRHGFAHSVEVWRQGELVAGLYGVYVGGVFSGESMFHKEDDAGKLAMLALIERLRAGGHTFIDTQMSVGLAEKWGSRLVGRSDFESLMRAAQRDTSLEF